MKPSINTGTPKATLVTINGVAILFSYETCAAFTNRRGESIVNPECVGLSPSTSRHLNSFGFKDAPAANTRAAFESVLSEAVAL